MNCVAILQTIEVHEGVYNDKPFIAIYADYYDDFGGHRDKVIDKEDTYNFAKDNCVQAYEWKYKNGERTVTSYFFKGLPVEFDKMKDRYREGLSVIRGIKKRS